MKVKVFQWNVLKIWIVVIRKDEKKKTYGRKVGEGVKFERIRRITGYLVGTTDRFNNAKKAEERDRVKHGTKGILNGN